MQEKYRNRRVGSIMPIPCRDMSGTNVTTWSISNSQNDTPTLSPNRPPCGDGELASTGS